MTNRLKSLQNFFWGSEEPFARKQIAALVIWAVLIALLVWFPGGETLSPGESELLRTVISAQETIREIRKSIGAASPPDIDPQMSGLIGVEWSPITTTLGSLESKRLSVMPAWAVVFRKWLRGSGLQPGDRITILSSGSFPGLALSAITAAESLDLEINLIVSLGSSTWGANTLAMPLSVMLLSLREEGIIRTKATAYTLGGGGETGGGMSRKGVSTLIETSLSEGVQLIMADSIEEMIQKKGELALMPGTRLLLQIGGSQADLGTDPAVIDLKPGFVLPAAAKGAGNGILAAALSRGIPVLHVLNIPALAKEAGISTGFSPYSAIPWKRSPLRLLTAVAIGIALLWKYRRWRIK